jgi:hypothetical protein
VCPLCVHLHYAGEEGRHESALGVFGRRSYHRQAAVGVRTTGPTVLPRLKVVGADLDMITVICEDDDGSGLPLFPRDMHLIEDVEPAPGTRGWTPCRPSCPSATPSRHGNRSRTRDGRYSCCPTSA